MIIVIVGPTGVGKTKLSVSLAKKYNAEIINGDSVQIYRGMNIGTAKVSEVEKEGIIHHLFDIRDVWEDYSLFDYQNDARKKISEILDKGKNVIIVGGTGLYIKSVLYDYHLGVSKQIDNNYDELSTNELYNKLLDVDKDIIIDNHNRRRIVRALNYYYENGHSISENKNGNDLLYDALFIGLTVSDREILYQRIDARVDTMLENGLVDEVKQFYDKNIYTRPLLSAIGYKELYEYFDNKISYDEAVRLIKRDSRRYAKRQYTFFNNQFDIKWFNTNFDNFDETILEVNNYIEKNKDYISRI